MLAYAAVVAFSETAFYGALGPLLTDLSDGHALTTLEAGMMTAAYPAGLVVAAVPAGAAAARWGSRRTASIGLWCMAIASASFALGSGLGVLALARLIQGAGACAAWGGVLSWLTVATPAGRRGETMGGTYSASFTGMLLGPLLGALAASAGRSAVFLPAAVGLAMIAAWGGPVPLGAARGATAHGPTPIRSAPAVRRALSATAVLGLATGGLNALAPLILADRGVPPIGTAAAFLVAAAPQIVLGPRVGRLIDRRGTSRFIAACFVVAAGFFAVMAWPRDPWLVGALVSGGALATFVILGPISLSVAQAADREGFGQGLAMALSTAAWGLGAAVGAVALTALAQATSPGAALTACAAACVLTAAAIMRHVGASRTRRSRAGDLSS
ncbi:MAG TPA: MFS transporter [Baekduia sp.]|nr:MFS transporter [Baekduia sp.]